MPRKSKRQKKGLQLIKIGLIFLLVFSIYRVNSLRILSFNHRFEEQNSTGAVPVKIKLPKFKMELPITEAVITDGTWEISSNGASHWANSANPGTNGNIVIYGHNKRHLFGPIRWLEVGDQIELTNSKGEVFNYEVSEYLITKPDDVSHVLSKDEELLTLYTCTGWFDKDRHIVVARPQKNTLD